MKYKAKVEQLEKLVDTLTDVVVNWDAKIMDGTMQFIPLTQEKISLIDEFNSKEGQFEWRKETPPTEGGE